MQKLIHNNTGIVLWVLSILVLSLVPVLFLFNEGFFVSDDGEWMVIRFTAFYQTLADGQIPPRFFERLNHGYGYPIGNFLYPGFFYIALLFKLVGFSFVWAMKGVIIASFLSSGLGSFLWLRKHFSNQAAFVGALAYTYFPYHIYDLYVRGSVGELLGFGVLPWLLFAIDRNRALLAGIFYGLLLLSHNTFAFLLTPFLLYYTFLINNRQLFLLYPVGLLLSAFFWLPSLVELPLTIFARIDIANWQTYFLSASNWNLFGILGLVLLIASFAFLFKNKEPKLWFFTVTFLIGLFFSTIASSVFWQLPLLPKLVQFPWRFLILTVWAGAFVSAAMVQMMQGVRQRVLFVLLSALILISSQPLLARYQPIIRDEGYYSTNEDTTTVKNEYMPKWITKLPENHPEKRIQVLSGDATIIEQQIPTQKEFVVTATSPSMLRINTIYYPGWEVRVNDVKQKIDYTNEYGLIDFAIPNGTNRITLQFRETPLRLAADLISLLTAVMITILLGKGMVKQFLNSTDKKRLRKLMLHLKV